jgi:pyruvate/2-oxoglutarate/acetoin dehydrogenase E1 component
MIYVAMEAADELAKDGVSVEIIDMRSILPFDEEAMLESVGKTNRCIVLYEAALTGGVGAEFVARLADKAFDYLDAPIKRVAALDTPVPYSPPLEDFYRPNKDKVIKAAKEILAY